MEYKCKFCMAYYGRQCRMGGDCSDIICSLFDPVLLRHLEWHV